MDIKNIFVKEFAVNYLWAGFVKKLESLYSAGVVAQRVEAFDVSGLCTQGETLAAIPLVQVNGRMAETILFFMGLFLFFSLHVSS